MWSVARLLYCSVLSISICLCLKSQSFLDVCVCVCVCVCGWWRMGSTSEQQRKQGAGSRRRRSLGWIHTLSGFSSHTPTTLATTKSKSEAKCKERTARHSSRY
jgi:hypothetical protein